MKTKNKLLTLLTLAAGAAAATAVSINVLKYLPPPKIFWQNLNHFVINGALEISIIQKQDQENLFYWFMI